ncbi:hypothetical protein PFLUOLIPICF7_18415 [Pseudomonas simiae]|jgi:hypothetical protein|nr:hypothetical protein PFLUOLIPICF7_18415 [Pseudomonas simiae]
MKSTILPVERAFSSRATPPILALHQAPFLNPERAPDFQ